MINFLRGMAVFFGVLFAFFAAGYLVLVAWDRTHVPRLPSVPAAAHRQVPAAAPAPRGSRGP